MTSVRPVKRTRHADRRLDHFGAAKTESNEFRRLDAAAEFIRQLEFQRGAEPANNWHKARERDTAAVTAGGA